MALDQTAAAELHAVVMPHGDIQLEWNSVEKPIDKSTKSLQDSLYERFSKAGPAAGLLFLGFSDHAIPLTPSLGFFRDFAGLFGKKLRFTPDAEALRERIAVSLDEDDLRGFCERVPAMIGGEYIAPDMLAGLWRALHEEFRREISQFKGSLEDFIHAYSPDIHLAGRVFFHLVENKNDDRPFAFLATYATGQGKGNQSAHVPLQYVLQEYGDHSEKLLELLCTVYRAARESSFLSEMLESGELFHPLAWSSREAFVFLKEIPLYEKAGILCRIPNWWKSAAQGPRLQVRIGDTSPSFVGMDGLLAFNAEIHLGDTPITLEEARQILAASDGLSLIKNKWVAVDHEKLRQTIEACEKARSLMQDGGITLRDALRLQLYPHKVLPGVDGGTVLEVTSGQWLADVTTRLRSPERIASIELRKSFKAKLRPYQKIGVNWLGFLHGLQLGMCLADDMGLGKTVQVIALLHAVHADPKTPASLLVIPASLLANWEQELTRFAPDLKFFIAHPSSGRDKDAAALDHTAIDRHDLVITTYAMAQKYRWISEHSWNYIILDEAQAIKNTSTKQTRIIKQLKSRNRIAMTGTPIENRLGDLWSLFDFLNPGLLGTAEEFSRFAKRLAEDARGYSRLRSVIAPYILRRLKTDRAVIADLPEKVEIKTYAALSKKQVLLYQQLVDDTGELLAQSDGIKRRGIILSSIMKFKQLCNHPAQYLGSGAYDEEASGKFSRLREICDIIREKRERVLVFTQFKEIIAPLQNFLEELFGRPGLCLHGSTAVAERRKIVAAFQGSAYVPFMVLSLKAGGIGLNLTEASHVIHFDRWWNPAVENQATDRAFRIGQTRTVMVHKFITRGTIEEKIDAMIESKKALAQNLLAGADEIKLTELSNDELMRLFTLTLS